MNRLLLAVFAAVMLGVFAFAQTSTPSAPDAKDAAQKSAAADNALPADTVVLAELNKSIDSKKAKEGDQVQAKVVQDVVAGGKVVLPRNSRLLGRVSQVKSGGKGEASSLSIAFEKAVLKGGQEVPFHATIQALAPAPRAPMLASSGGYGDMGGGAPAGAGAGPVSAGTTSGPASTPMSGGMSGSAPSAPTTSAPGDTAGTSAAGSTATGMSPSGQLSAGSKGVMGYPGVVIDSSAPNGSAGTVLTNSSKNVKLDSGTQLVLRVSGQ